MARSQSDFSERTRLLDGDGDSTSSRQYNATTPSAQQISETPSPETPKDKQVTAKQLKFVFAGLALPVK